MHLANQTKKLTNKDYVHLHNHTQYSLLDGLTKIPDLMQYVKEQGMESVAITDHGTMSGSIEFYKEAKANGIRPLLGIETYIASRKYTDKEATLDKPNYHLILISMNDTGYKNLMKLSSMANLEGFYYRARIDHELIEKYNEGIICLSGCMGSELGDALSNNLYDDAIKIAQWYKGIFGDRYYIEVQDHGHSEHPSFNKQQFDINEQLIRLAKELDIKVVVTADAHYLKHEDRIAHEILLCVQTNSFLNDTNRMSLKNIELHVTEPKELIKRWGSEHPDFITNTSELASRCEVEIPLGKILIPKYPVPSGEDEKSYLELLVFRGLAWRYGKVPRKDIANLSIKEAQKLTPVEPLERAKYELSVIESMGFNGYFLIVQDLINWGKDNGIIFGPGRGSAAGSIISYSMRITEIDPLEYNLMFERFLNPNRVSMPDIDIDIQDTRRDEVIAYCVEKYGIEKVANIVTFGRMAARNAVRDVARVLEVPYADADRLAKMIPPPVQGRHIPLKVSIKRDKALKSEYQNNPVAKQIFDLAIQLEGTIRSHGVHAAGVVIAPEAIVGYTPLEMAQKGVISTQYSMGPIDELGLLKIDFLGLSNLTTINNALRIIKKVEKKDIDLLEIPNDDPVTFDLLQRADTTGVFQLESAGMKRYLKELRPTLFADIIAMNALYRPGPMGEIPNFIAGKHDPENVKYLHQSLEPILEDTYGVLIYQEQIIKLLQLVAGYTPGEADLVRKAIGKKKRDILAAEEPKFIDGCIKQGLTKTQANNLWALIQPFADYSFPKAHATCYAQIAYWTAYLKANHPSAFMASLMTTDYDDIDRLAIEINECTRMGIQVLAPDINESFIEFAVVPDKKQIRFGLKAIKNVGSNAAEEILRVREEGQFTNLENYLERVNPRLINKKGLESLIKTGAFDRFGERQMLLDNLELMLAYASKFQKQADSNQLDLFGEENTDKSTVVSTKLQLLAPSTKIDTAHYLKWERELLGLYLSDHPLKRYERILSFRCIPLISMNQMPDDKTVKVGGILIDLREISTKKGQKMAFAKIEDLSSEIELVIFPGVYEKYIELLSKDNVLIFEGKASSKGNNGAVEENKKIIVDIISIIDEEDSGSVELDGPGAKAIDQNKLKLYLRLKDTSDNKKLMQLKKIIDSYSGNSDVVLVVGEEESKQVIKLPGGVNIQDKEVFPKLKTLIGDSNLIVS